MLGDLPYCCMVHSSRILLIEKTHEVISASFDYGYNCTKLYYTLLYYITLYYTILYYTILYYTILYYIILYYTVLYYNIFIIIIIKAQQFWAQIFL